MAFSNKMSVLLDKIERRLGTQGLNLPPELQKDVWVKVIEQDTIPTFSRYFPHKIEMYLGPEDLSKKEPATYLIDENKIPGDIEIIGVGDISWKNLYTFLNISLLLSSIFSFVQSLSFCFAILFGSNKEDSAYLTFFLPK